MYDGMRIYKAKAQHGHQINKLPTSRTASIKTYLTFSTDHVSPTTLSSASRPRFRSDMKPLEASITYDL